MMAMARRSFEPGRLRHKLVNQPAAKNHQPNLLFSFRPGSTATLLVFFLPHFSFVRLETVRINMAT